MERIPASGPPRSRSLLRTGGGFRFGFAFSGGLLIIVPAALIVLAVLVCLLSETPAKTFYYFFAGPFLGVYSFGNMLNAAVPLIFGALGVSIAMRAGSLNLGGEGQIYLGAFTATAAALYLSGWGFFGGVIAVLTGAITAGAAAAMSGFFKARWNTNELITSFLLSNALIPIVNFLVTGPFLDPETSLQSTKKISETLRLPRILPPSNLSVSLLIALAAAAAAHIFLKHTRLGYEFRMAGNNELFARYGGINTRMNTVLAMFISGAMYGLAGALAVFGTYYGTVKEFSGGMGWNSLAAALVAGFYPPAVIPAAFFLAWISSGAKIAMQNTGISFEVASVVQSVIFFLATSAVLRGLFAKKEQRR